MTRVCGFISVDEKLLQYGIDSSVAYSKVGHKFGVCGVVMKVSVKCTFNNKFPLINYYDSAIMMVRVARPRM